MRDHIERTWGDDEPMVLPPTPGRTLNISSATSQQQQPRKSTDKKVKRRLDLDNDQKSAVKKQRPSDGVGKPKKEDLSKSRIKTESHGPKKDRKTSTPAAPQIFRDESKSTPKEENRKYKSEDRSEEPPKTKVKTEENLPPKTKPPEDTITGKRLKTQAWAKILRYKQKLYIPHTSDPRTQEEDVTPSIDDKENSGLAVNVVATGSLMITPIKLEDHHSIIKFMSITPQLLSPLADDPLMFK